MSAFVKAMSLGRALPSILLPLADAAAGVPQESPNAMPLSRERRSLENLRSAGCAGATCRLQRLVRRRSRQHEEMTLPLLKIAAPLGCNRPVSGVGCDSSTRGVVQPTGKRITELARSQRIYL